MNCPICSSGNSHVVWHNQEFSVRECRNCLQVFTRPRARVDIYDDAYYAAYAAKVHLDAPMFDAILARLATLHTPGRLLDVGCGIGTFAALAQQRDWRAMGIDTSVAAIRAACETYPQVEFRCGLLSDIADRIFDAITLFDVLMYVPEPAQLLARVRGSLSPGGLCVVKAVNRPMTFLRALHWGLFPMRRRGQSLLFLPNALYHFSPRTLARLVKPQGFRMVACDRVTMRVPPLTLPLRERLVQGYGRILTRVLLGASHFVSYFERVE
jgi:2-polyprenyl-3-methyl-5-hydroxy-6-metoxy-1,4-benzoquinol methylase